MEEILASIRRIIADDQSLPSRQAQSAPAAPQAEVAPVAQEPAAKPRPAFVQPPANEPTYAEIKASVEVSSEASYYDSPIQPQPARAEAPVEAFAEPVQPAPRPQPVQERPVPVAESVETARESAPVRAASAASRAEAGEPLVSPATDTAVAAAFKMLAASRLANNSDEIMTLAREMIRPLLRNWIDENLPNMVERMVRAEIERVARGGR